MELHLLHQRKVLQLFMDEPYAAVRARVAQPPGHHSPQKVLGLVAGQGPADEVALNFVAVPRPQKIYLAIVFDASRSP